MLLTRVLTAAVLLPLAVAGILWLPTAAVAVVLGVFFVVGAWEWGVLMRLPNGAARITFAGLLGLATLVLWWQQGAASGLILGLSALWWLLAVWLLLRFPHTWDVSVAAFPLSGALGLLLLTAPFVALVHLHAAAAGPGLMLSLFILIWAADTGAYFAGRALGRHKLAPQISPGKTWEGAVGGTLLTLAAAIVCAYCLDYSHARAAGFIVLAALVAVVSIVGDLTISMFKRQAGVKDTGTLLPGHGGVLDRLDSLLAAAPCFVLGLAILPQ